MSKVPFLAILMVPFLLGHTDCEYGGEWSGSRDTVDIACDWRSLTEAVHHDRIHYHCTITDSVQGGGTPYVVLAQDHCPRNVIWGIDGKESHATVELACHGDTIAYISFSACQSGTAPYDNCTEPEWQMVHQITDDD